MSHFMLSIFRWGGCGGVGILGLGFELAGIVNAELAGIANAELAGIANAEVFNYEVQIGLLKRYL